MLDISYGEDEALKDEHGYPTEYALERIIGWSMYDFEGLIEFVKDLWWSPDFGWNEKTEYMTTEYLLSTGGWSGNEDLIDALGKNHMFWIMCWFQSRRGGHYIFEIKHDRDKKGFKK